MAWWGASACDLQIHAPPQGPKGRVAAVKIRLSHGFFQALPHIPFGWHFVIDNDPSGMTSISANAVVGAAFLDRSDLSGIFSIAPEAGTTCADIIDKHLIGVTVTLYLDDKMRNYGVNGADLKLVE